MNAIQLSDVQFAYPDAKRLALNHVSLAVPDGQLCAVVGNAGSGKTTLCTLCAGFIPQFYPGAYRGETLVDGQNVIERPVAELVRHVGLVSSNPFSQVSGARFTVFEEVAFGLENMGLPRQEIIERVEWAMEALGITALRDRSPFELSGGQQQRLVIAATLAQRPPVLVLDEPSTQLDPPTVAELGELLRSLASNGTTILLAEHRLEWVAGLADRVIVLDMGAVIADDTPAEVFSNPLLLERGIGWPRPALIASQLQQQGQLARPLPVTEQGLLDALAQHPVALPAPAAPAPAANAAPFVELRDVRFVYPSGVEALKGVSFRVGPGERVALLGRNGAGKSTMVRHLNGLNRPTSGQVQIGGVDTTKASVARHARTVGIVFQDTRNQLFARTVRDEIAFGPRNLGRSAAEIGQLVDASIEALGLHEFASEHPYDLPIGLRRLVAVAAVLAMDPPLLVLDEPTAGLDTQAVERLTAVCKRQTERGKSVLVVTHDLDFAYEALERVTLMRNGLITLDSTWAALEGAQIAELDDAVDLPLQLRIRHR